jgi:hypothetical protein
VRSRASLRDLRGVDGVAIRHAGDGRTYERRLGTGAALDGVTDQAPCVTGPGAWRTTLIELGAFRPRARGRPVPAAAALDAGRVQTFGLLGGDGQVGAFELEVAWIGADRAPRPSSHAGARGGGARGAQRSAAAQLAHLPRTNTATSSAVPCELPTNRRPSQPAIAAGGRSARLPQRVQRKWWCASRFASKRTAEPGCSTRFRIPSPESTSSER